jgi:hypothetical protein
MSQHQFFRRTPVQPQAAQKMETITFPAPTRGLVQNENESYMQPGSAVVMDFGVRIRQRRRPQDVRGQHQQGL